MKYRHSAFVAVFVAASAVACAVLPFSIASYIDACRSGFGAELDVERAWLYSEGGTTILAITFRYSSPDRLSTTPREFWLNATTGGGTASISGNISKVFDRGVSDVVTASAPLTAEQAATLTEDGEVTVAYWVWVDVPARGSASALEGSRTVGLEGGA